MQSLVRRLTVVTRHHSQRQPNLSFNSHRISHTHPQPSNLGHHIPSSSAIRHFHSWRSLSTIIRSSLSRPTIVQQLSSASRNYLSTLLSKGILVRSLPRVQFQRQNFGFNQNYISYRRSWRSWFNRLTPNDVVLGLIVSNVAVFLFWRIANAQFMLNNFTISLDNIKSGRLHTLITNAFSHIDTWHLIYNMIGLYFFAGNVRFLVLEFFLPLAPLILNSFRLGFEQIVSQFGPEFLLKLYLAGAIGGSVFYLVHQAYKAQTSKDWRAVNSSREFALGASGAVNAVMLLNIFLNPRATIYLNFFIPVPAALLGIILIGKDLLNILEGDNTTSGSAHLGGIAVAAIAWAGVRKGRF